MKVYVLKDLFEVISLYKTKKLAEEAKLTIVKNYDLCNHEASLIDIEEHYLEE